VRGHALGLGHRADIVAGAAVEVDDTFGIARPHRQFVHIDVGRVEQAAFLGDGDVTRVIATATGDSGIDIYMGSGGAPEGVLSAAALRCLGGQMQGRLILRNDDEKTQARKLGITDLARKYTLTELARGDVMFAATGVTSGAMLRGVRRLGNGAETHSIVMRSKTGTVRWISARHDFSIKTGLPNWA